MRHRRRPPSAGSRAIWRRAESAAVYGRVGTCQQEFGTVASWLVDVLNVLTGNLDRAGGAMFTQGRRGRRQHPRRAGPRQGRALRPAREPRARRSPRCSASCPPRCLAEEIETPGDGQVRALVTVAGNPVLSTPNGARLARALASLDFMVSFDIYLNETTRHAHVILPGLSPLESPHYDVALWQLAIRNYARYSPPVFAPPADRPSDWEAILRLTGIVMGQGADTDAAALDDFIALQQLQAAVGAAGSPVAGREPGELLAALAPRRGPERLVDIMLRTGPYGDGFGANPDGLSLDVLEADAPRLDLGALAPRIPEVLRTPSGKIELAPPEITGDVRAPALAAEPSATAPLALVGRRDLRSNNSWMHNIPSLVRAPNRCTVWVHPDDADRLGLADGGPARLSSRVGRIELPVEVTDAVMPGVVSVPHGWGHDAPGTALRVAASHAGANSNLLADELATDPLSGNAVLNGIPVTLEPVG